MIVTKFAHKFGAEVKAKNLLSEIFLLHPQKIGEE